MSAEFLRGMLAGAVLMLALLACAASFLRELRAQRRWRRAGALQWPPPPMPVPPRRSPPSRGPFR